MTTTPLGKVAITPRGEYDSAASYERLDLVRYDGSAYLVLQPVTGVTPVDGDDYMLVVQKGDSIEYNGEEIASLSVGNNLAATYEEGGNLHLDIGSDIANHLSDTDNPHGVTAEQAGAMKNSFGVLSATDLFAWGLSQTISGLFVVNPSVTTENVPVSGVWLSGVLFASSVCQFMLVFTGIEYYYSLSQGGAFNSWQKLATTDYAVNKAGDTMSGALKFFENKGLVNTQYSTTAVMTYLQSIFDNTCYSLEVGNFGPRYFVGEVGNSWKTAYNILHTGNFSDYAVNKAGDTMTGDLCLRSDNLGQIARLFNIGTYAGLSVNDLSTGAWAQLLINRNVDNANALVLQRSDGSWLNVLHAGNSNMTALVSTETTPTVNNTINWTYG